MSKRHHKDMGGDQGSPEEPNGREQAPAVHELSPDQIVEESPPADELDTLRAQLADKEKELAELKDKYLRSLADSENARKRTRQQSEETIRIERENLLRELLPIVDNLERALEAARGGGNGKSIVDGVEMTLRSILDYLKARGVTPVEALGQTFDPARHEAVDQVESLDYPPNTVVKEFQTGYQAGQRVLRPARVSVSKDSPERRDDEE